MHPSQHLTQTLPRLFTRGAVMVLLAAACVSAPAPAAVTLTPPVPALSSIRGSIS
jgi:hypothetical protein